MVKLDNHLCEYGQYVSKLSLPLSKEDARCSARMLDGSFQLTITREGYLRRGREVVTESGIEDLEYRAYIAMAQVVWDVVSVTCLAA